MLLTIVAMVICARKRWRSTGTAKQQLGSLFQICANVRAFSETYSSCHTGKILFVLNVVYQMVELAHDRKFPTNVYWSWMSPWNAKVWKRQQVVVFSFILKETFVSRFTLQSSSINRIKLLISRFELYFGRTVWFPSFRWCFYNYNKRLVHMITGQYKTWTADHGLRTGYKIRTRNKTRTTDWV